MSEGPVPEGEPVPAPVHRDEILTGWGNTAPSRATVWEPDHANQIAPIVNASGQANAIPPALAGRGSIGRGMGRSYGDAAQNAGGNVVSSVALNRILSIDRAAGTVTCEAGVSLDALLRFLVPRGWFPTVIPGTSFVSVGGAIAADIHGKFRHGSFCDYVDSAKLVTPQRGTITIDARTTPDEYWATAGGMGLTGIVSEATLRLHRIETSQMVVETQRCANVDDCMAAMMQENVGDRYTVAWIDCLASGGSLGRSILERGQHAQLSDLDTPMSETPLDYRTPPRISAPPWVPTGLLNAWSLKAFNELWFRKSPRTPRRTITSIPHFFHPLDMVTGWNRIYGKHGFVQYQFVVPYGHEEVVRRVLARLAAEGCGSFLAVLKRFETANDGLLSFPMPGWTLALDIPAMRPALGELFDEFDRWVCEAGGRVYLAKDARVDPELLDTMYPKLPQWRAIRDALDPPRTLQSDLSRRLRLC